MGFDLFCASVIGAGHIKKNIPCEDYGMVYETDDAKVFALGDGHGDANCFRSCRGSKFACQAAVRQMSEFALRPFTSLEEEFDRNVYFLICDILGDWKSAVQKDVAEDPFTETELNSAPRLSDDFRSGIDVERAYGTTLIAGLLTEQYLLLIQQGDGHCDVFNADGKVMQPIPWDAHCVGNATTSLCDPDASERFRYTFFHLKTNPIAACVAGSDGVEDSFPTSMDKTHSFYRSLIIEAETGGTDAMEKALPEKLSYLSEHGSADDVTVCGFIDLEKAVDLIELFRRQNEAAELAVQKEMLDSKIMSIEEGGKFSQLRQVYSKASFDYEAALHGHPFDQKSVDEKKERLTSVEAEYKQYCERYESLKRERNNVEKKLHELARSTDGSCNDINAQEEPSDGSASVDLDKQPLVPPMENSSDAEKEREPLQNTEQSADAASSKVLSPDNVDEYKTGG